MGEWRSSSPAPHLDLNNFDSAEAEKSRYVLTSPRSLESCARLGIKPVELLVKSLNDLLSEQRDVPLEMVRVMHESYEKERTKLLQMCRDERERIIQQAARWPSANKVSRLGKQHDSKLKDEPAMDIPYAVLCSKEKSMRKTPCSAADRSTICSLGELRHSPAIEVKLQKLTDDIRREMCVPISQRDRKIAALMLVKHQVEEDRLSNMQQEEEERGEARRREEARRAQAEKRRRKKLMQSMQRWHEELEARRRLRLRREDERVGQLKQEVILQEERWRRLKEQVEAQRRGKTAAAQKEAEGRRCYQERLLRNLEEVEKKQQERERQVAMKREQKASRSKLQLERKEKKRLQEENGRELLHHLLLKQQVEKHVEEGESRLREALERKMQQSCEKHARHVEARVAELQERAAQEEKQIQRAQLRAKLQSIQQLTHKHLLVKVSQQRTLRATEHTLAHHRKRAQQTHQHNKHRQLRHQRLRENVQREEEAARRARESSIAMKEWRRERLRREREHIQQEAHKQALASFHLRERVRQQTQRRSFAHMAQEAQLAASISRLNL
ncbi:coiled-coil domain-containing protein 177 [Dunckerocampus dactyliophorus]|uniref:coiled-coil domain-containing protein 177 n=1 Tax=Dunckerocampus dactyliophorus TaxID=161453 RepID=UPI0024052DC2|nr:coiled-coil domain-containing protein 177 [Dunckerocampus dactyliophorus]